MKERESLVREQGRSGPFMEVELGGIWFWVGGRWEWGRMVRLFFILFLDKGCVPHEKKKIIK